MKWKSLFFQVKIMRNMFNRISLLSAQRVYSILQMVEFCNWTVNLKLRIQGETQHPWAPGFQDPNQNCQKASLSCCKHQKCREFARNRGQEFTQNWQRFGILWSSLDVDDLFNHFCTRSFGKFKLKTKTETWSDKKPDRSFFKHELHRTTQL